MQSGNFADDFPGFVELYLKADVVVANFTKRQLLDLDVRQCGFELGICLRLGDPYFMLAFECHLFVGHYYYQSYYLNAPFTKVWLESYLAFQPTIDAAIGGLAPNGGATPG